MVLLLAVPYKSQTRNNWLETNYLLARTNEVNAGSLLKANNAKNKQAAQRINAYMADPGPIPFRRETVAEAQRYMAKRIREFEERFGE